MKTIVAEGDLHQYFILLIDKDNQKRGFSSFKGEDGSRYLFATDFNPPDDQPALFGYLEAKRIADTIAERWEQSFHHIAVINYADKDTVLLD